jgi:hypothetical protein
MLLVSVLAISQRVGAADRTVLLVTSRACQMTSISTLDIRKAYLGIRVSYEDEAVRAFRLTSDARLNQIFLQAVVAMSEQTYERRLVSQLIKYGRPRPQEFESITDLVTAINNAPCSVSYLWKIDLDAQVSLKALKVIWQEN